MTDEIETGGEELSLRDSLSEAPPASRCGL
jgi:hypothetical protein